MAEKSGEEKHKDEDKPSTDKDSEGTQGESAALSKKKDSPDDCRVGLKIPPEDDPSGSK